MTEARPVGAMTPSGLAGAVRSGSEAAALDIAVTGSSEIARDITLGTLSLRVPHNATAADLARAVRLAIAGRLK